LVAVAPQETVTGKLPLHGRHGAADARVLRRQESDDRQEQQARVELRAAVRLRERPERLAPRLVADLCVDLVADAAPALEGALRDRIPRSIGLLDRKRPTPSPSSG